jgi:hypothetical protein
MLFDDKETFQHFGFARTIEEEQAATTKAAELLANSPYKDQLATAQKFVKALEMRAKQIPNLISPHLGNNVLSRWNSAALPVQAAAAPATPDQNVIVALPLGGRIKLDPWDNSLMMLNAKPVGAVAEREKMPFEVTPFILYLTRDDSASLQTPGAVSAQSQTDPTSSPTQPR